jgi:DegV family protein with EDD domain
MARVAIITDSSADLPPNLAKREEITVVPVSAGIVVGEASARERLRIGAGHIETPVLPEIMARPEIVDGLATAFAAAAGTHDAAVAVLLSSRLGGVVAAAQQARDHGFEAFPIEIVDSRSASLGLGFQALRAASLARQGQSASAIAGDLRAATDRYHVVFSVESVEHLRQSGQIGRSAAMIAEALQLKPLLRIDEGQIVPYERVRTRSRAIAELAEFVRQMPAVERCAVLYATNEDDARRLADAIAGETNLRRDRLMVAHIGETLAAQVGPGALGVAVVESESEQR